MTPDHIVERLNWCNQVSLSMAHLWEFTIFTDETYFYLERNQVKVWSRHQIEDPIHVKSAGVMVWGSISSQGTLRLVVNTGPITGQRFVAIMNDVLVPAANETFPLGWFLQMDNAPGHTASVAQNYFESNNINVNVIVICVLRLDTIKVSNDFIGL